MRNLTTLVILILLIGACFMIFGLRTAPAPAITLPVNGNANQYEAESVENAVSADIADAGSNETEVPRDSASPEENETPAHAPEEHAAKDIPADVPKLLDGWEKPKLAFLLSGQQNGYFEPCGCSAEQYGGFSRRGDLAKKMTDRGWNIAGLDLGGLVKHTREQTPDKFATMINGLVDLNYAAVGVGPAELRLGPEVLLLADPEQLPFVCANVLLFGARDTGVPLLSKTVEISGVKCGVTAVIGDSFVKTVSANPDIEFLPVKKSLQEALDEINKQDPELRILLSYAKTKETEQIIADFPDFDFVITHTDLEEGEEKAKQIGSTTMLSIGQKGKHTGVLGYYPNAASGDRFRFELVKLDRYRFEEDPRMVEHMRQYQEQLRSLARADLTTVAHMSNASFVGAEKCAECHEYAYDIWSKTPHAKAFESLDPAHKGHGYERLKGINRSFDPECLSCHVTGWDAQEVLRFAGGFVNEEFADDADEKLLSKILRGNQCENCHGPGSRHIELIEEGEDVKAAKLMRVTKAQAKAQTGCYKCHDMDNSPKFDFDKYWKDVDHTEPE